jgi:drug/metabolite transporter (DMT)-like permease
MNFLFGSIYLVAALLITDSMPETVGFRGLASSVYVGIFEMGVTFFFWLRALQLAETTDKVSNLIYIAPFLSLIFVNFVLHETVYFTTLAGLLLIIGGIIIQNKKRKGVN